MSEITLSTKGYIIWDTVVTDQAVVFARKLIDRYNEGKEFYKYRIHEAKGIEEYMLMKVWHILCGSGISMIHRIYKRKDEVHVSIQLTPEEPEYIDSSDSEREPEESPAPSPA